MPRAVREEPLVTWQASGRYWGWCLAKTLRKLRCRVCLQAGLWAFSMSWLSNSRLSISASSSIWPGFPALLHDSGNLVGFLIDGSPGHGSKIWALSCTRPSRRLPTREASRERVVSAALPSPHSSSQALSAKISAGVSVSRFCQVLFQQEVQKFHFGGRGRAL